MDRIAQGYPDIAFIGGMGSGKTTAAKLLEQFGYRRWSFAGYHKGGLRDIATRLFGPDVADDREVLLAVGEIARDIRASVWLDNLVAALEASGRKQPAVLDDMRFMNEYRALKGEGFVVVRIHAPEWVRVDRLKKTGKWQGEWQLTAPSEIALNGVNADYNVTNDASTTMDEFEDRVVEVLRKERRRRA